MESKNVKVIDEHGIDRNANVVCAFDLDGSDYVVYWIERDTENDNIFVSKIIKNLDGTSNMLNIDDSFEKEKVSEVVRELVKHAVGSEADKLEGDTLTLPSGKSIKINSVLFNKEQSINVQRTYITTVKKTVTKVSEDFYSVKSLDEPKVEEINSVVSVQPVIETQPVVEPVVVTSTEPVVSPVVSEVNQVLPVEEVKTEVAPVVESVVVPVVSEPVVTTILEEPKVEPVIPEVAPVLPVQPVSELKTEPVVPEVSPVLPVDEVKAVVEPEVAPVVDEPVVSSVVAEPKIEPVDVSNSNTLVFDASKESNLNKALGEASETTPVSVSNIESVREFGVDEEVKSVSESIPTPSVESTVKEDTKVLTKKMGFANNKFFMAIAIVFFMASCVFLGYEVFQFFQLR